MSADAQKGIGKSRHRADQSDKIEANASARCAFARGQEMRMLLIGLIGAGSAFVTPTQAKLIGTDFYVPSVMLQMCKSEIARGQAGFCTGYVIAKWEELAAGEEVCVPSNVEYEDMLSAVIRRFEEGSGWMKSGDTDLQVRVALRDAWPCKK